MDKRYSEEEKDTREELKKEIKREIKKQNRKLKIKIPWKIQKILIIIAIIALAVGAGAIGMKRYITHESQTTKLGFEDIGELATQEANCTEVNVTEDVRKLFGIDIPFTQSKYIYSYNVIVKAGYDFGEIRYEVKKDSIKVKLPEVRILSSQVDEDSFRVYHEKESIFNQIRLEENNAAFAKLKEQAEKDAVANGLYENARSNAKTILKGYFAQAYDLDDYKITFEGGEGGNTNEK